MPRRSAASRTIKLETNVVSWALRVSRSSSASASRSNLPTSRSAISLASPTSSQLSWSSHGRPIPGRCEPCPGNVKASIGPTVDGEQRQPGCTHRRSSSEAARTRQVNCRSCPGGETGKRDGLKHHCSKGLAGSSPAPGTNGLGTASGCSPVLRPQTRHVCLDRGPRIRTPGVTAPRVFASAVRMASAAGGCLQVAIGALGSARGQHLSISGASIRLQPAEHADQGHHGANHQDPPAHRP